MNGITLSEEQRTYGGALSEILPHIEQVWLWRCYLVAAANAFRYDGHMNVRILLARRRDALPITRDCMSASKVHLQG